MANDEEKVVWITGRPFDLEPGEKIVNKGLKSLAEQLQELAEEDRITMLTCIGWDKRDGMFKIWIIADRTSDERTEAFRLIGGLELAKTDLLIAAEEGLDALSGDGDDY